MTSRRQPFDRSKLNDTTRLQTTLRWPTSRSRGNTLGVVPRSAPDTAKSTTGGKQAVHPQPSAVSSQVPSGNQTPDAIKMRALREGSSMHADSVYKRAIWLMSDAVVLTIASPFFAVWWIARAIKRMAAPKE